MTTEQKLHANIKTAAKFGLKVYLAYQNNILVNSYVCAGSDNAYNKLKFSYPVAHIHIELLQLKNKETLNSPEVYEIVKELFGKSFTDNLNNAVSSNTITTF